MISHLEIETFDQDMRSTLYKSFSTSFHKDRNYLVLRFIIAENNEVVAVEDFIDVGNILCKSWVALCMYLILD